jgi:peptidoglycan/LPS O-acetylase OafA/YrhL
MTAMLDTPRPSLDAGDSPPLPGEPHGDGQARKFRPDIEGVRALAVLLVVLYHAHLLGITGGYVGVDVFFVLSGFLITRQLVAGVDRRGIRELPSFYGRRIKRLLPASTTVVVATVIASYLWAPALQVKSITTDAIYTTFYGLNYHLAATGTSYLHQGAAPSPLQHFWSLGVEEQFYLAWPLLIVACLLLPLRVRYGALMLLLSSIAAVSFWYCATTTMSEPSWAYFSIHTRAWELAAGGLIALTSPLWTRLPSIVSNLMAWAAFAAIVASAWILTDATQYPGTAAAVPVLATAAILAAGCAQRRHSIERLLSEPVIQGIGKVSYSWYLWHWPMLILFPYIAGEALPWPRRVEVVFLSLGFAILSYHVVENPVRKLRRLNFEWLRTAAALAAVVIAISVIAANTTETTGDGLVVHALAIDTGKPGVVKRITETLNNSLAINKAPRNLTPSLADAANDLSVNYRNGCHGDFQAPTIAPPCISGDPKGSRTAVIFGDSHMEQFYGGLNVAAKKKHWRLISWTRSACPSASLTVYAPPLKRTYTECDQWRAATIKRIIAAKPDLILMGESDDAPGPDMTPAQYARGITTTLKQFSAAHLRVSYMLDTPFPGYDIPGCIASHLSQVSKCVFEVTKGYKRPQRRVAATQAAQQGGAKVYDPALWLCAAKCPVVVANMLVWRDTGHMTDTYSRWLAPVLMNLLVTHTHDAAST